MSSATVATSVYASEPDPGLADVCTGPVECLLADVVSPLTIALTTGLLALVAIAAFSYLRAARSECEEERSRIRAEIEAFDDFAGRVADLDVPAARVTDGGAALLGGSTGTDRQLERARTAYRETVMDVPHYEEDYDETLGEHMRAEYGDEVATAVTQGPRLTPQLQGALVEGSRNARDERVTLLRTIDRELDDIADARETLERIDDRLAELDDRPLPQRSYDELASVWWELDDLEAECDDLVADRQADLQDGVTMGTRRRNGHDFRSYLYDPLDVTYPVLAAGTSVCESVATAKRRVLGSLTRRV